MHLTRASVAGEQGLESLEVVAVDNEVVVGTGGVKGLGGVGNQRAVWYGQVVERR